MLFERSELTVKDGTAADFATMMRTRAKPLLLGVPGVRGVQFGQGIENPSKFILMVHWESMDAHTGYRTLPACTELRQMMGPFVAGGGMEHFEME